MAEFLKNSKKIELLAAKTFIDDINKWEGENVNENVKDSWEDEIDDEEEYLHYNVDEIKNLNKVNNDSNEIKTQNENPQNKISMKNNPKLQNINDTENDLNNLTDDEFKRQQKIKLEKLQKEEDLKSALETFGINEQQCGLDAIHPTDKNEFSEFAKSLIEKIFTYKNHDEFQYFMGELMRNLCMNLSIAEIKKIKMILNQNILEKQKIEKEKQQKRVINNIKNKSKVKLRIEHDDLDALDFM